MNRVLLLIIAAFILKGCINQNSTPPNIIFILADDMRDNSLGAMGHPFVQTPNMDKLMQNGSRFSNAYITEPVCSPSRVSIFTRVINAHGFIRHSRVYEGNKPDTATLSDMIEDLKKYSAPNADHTIVIDAGIATENNLALVREKGYKYVCVSRERLKDYPIEPSDTKITQLTDREKNKVELAIFRSEGFADTWM